MRALSTVVAVTSAFALAACGSSHKATGSPLHSRALALADCMRAHGVPNFPDPTAGGGGFSLPPGADPRSPAFKSAQIACKGLAPGRPGGVTATESQFVAALAFAKCMRVHEFPEFPDPTRFDAPPGPILIVGPGLFYRVQQGFDPTSPAATRAISACGGQS